MSLFTGIQNKNQHKIEIGRSKNAADLISVKKISPLKENSLLWLKKIKNIKAAALPEGFVLNGYYLGTFEFDSLTGHPGIRY